MEMVKNLKLLLLHMEYPPILGGGARYTNNFISGLVKQGFKTVFITSGDVDSVEEINDFLTIKRFKVFREMYFRKASLTAGVDILLQQIRVEGPDILHTIYLEESLIGQIANFNYGLPHFITHTQTPMYREESITKNATWSLFDYINSNKSALYIAPSIAYRNSLLQSGVERGSIEVIYPGVDRGVFKEINDAEILKKMRNKLRLDKEDVVIFIPCLLRKRKGLNFVAKAFSKLNIAGRNLKVVVSGIPRTLEEENIFNELRMLATPTEVVIHDEFKDNDMPILYNLADITVLPSEAEGLGISLLEAMACRCPVIGTNVIGINEVIRNAYNGFLCESGDIDDLNRAIIEVLTNSDLRQTFVENSILMLDSKFNLENQAVRYIELYNASVIGRNQNSSCVLFRFVESRLEIFLEKSRDSGFRLPKETKKISESWLQAAIRRAGIVLGYQVSIPYQLFSGASGQTAIEEQETACKSRCVYYAFEISKDASAVNNKAKTGFWSGFDNALAVVVNKEDREIIKRLKKDIEEDGRFKRT